MIDELIIHIAFIFCFYLHYPPVGNEMLNIGYHSVK